MIPADSVPAHLLRPQPDKQNIEAVDSMVEDEPDEKESNNEKHILCRQCRQVITSANERIEVQGSHQHTFANPHGIIYEIGCFRSVIGCGYAGPPSDEFSWFRGFSWRVAVCAMCLTHLGWLFTSLGSVSFNGLILDRLIESG